MSELKNKLKLVAGDSLMLQTILKGWFEMSGVSDFYKQQIQQSSLITRDQMRLGADAAAESPMFYTT